MDRCLDLRRHSKPRSLEYLISYSRNQQCWFSIMHSRDHQISDFNFSRQVHLAKEHSAGSVDLVDMASEPDSGRADHMWSDTAKFAVARDLSGGLA
jgi:hypothetical protein